MVLYKATFLLLLVFCTCTHGGELVIRGETAQLHLGQVMLAANGSSFDVSFTASATFANSANASLNYVAVIRSTMPVFLPQKAMRAVDSSNQDIPLVEVDVDCYGGACYHTLGLDEAAVFASAYPAKTQVGVHLTLNPSRLINYMGTVGTFDSDVSAHVNISLCSTRPLHPFVVASSTSWTLSSSVSSTDFTVSFWAHGRESVFEAVLNIGSLSGAHNKLWFGWRSDARIMFAFTSDDLDIAMNTTVFDPAWHHYAFTYDATSDVRSIYLDKALIGSDTTEQDFQGNTDAILNNINRIIAEVKIWDTALDPSDIAFAYDNVPVLVGDMIFESSVSSNGTLTDVATASPLIQTHPVTFPDIEYFCAPAE